MVVPWARLGVYFVLGLCPFARESYGVVMRMLTSRIPGSRALASARVNRSPLCRARVRLGEGVLKTVQPS
ncbi:transposase domain-containing protein [Streptomyces sp. NPDC059982]|uniref:transposase domain-containing protein n=1 Tax=unclassified Streptomyces TaxID=2593676 RepID=UPI00369E3BE5